jgi:hypothetical protein
MTIRTRCSAPWLLTRSDWDVLHVHGFSYRGELPIAVTRLSWRSILLKTTRPVARLDPSRLADLIQ